MWFKYFITVTFKMCIWGRPIQMHEGLHNHGVQMVCWLIGGEVWHQLGCYCVNNPKVC